MGRFVSRIDRCPLARRHPAPRQAPDAPPSTLPATSLGPARVLSRVPVHASTTQGSIWSAHSMADAPPSDPTSVSTPSGPAHVPSTTIPSRRPAHHLPSSRRGTPAAAGPSSEPSAAGVDDCLRQVHPVVARRPHRSPRPTACEVTDLRPRRTGIASGRPHRSAGSRLPNGIRHMGPTWCPIVVCGNGTRAGLDRNDRTCVRSISRCRSPRARIRSAPSPCSAR